MLNVQSCDSTHSDNGQTIVHDKCYFCEALFCGQEGNSRHSNDIQQLCMTSAEHEASNSIACRKSGGCSGIVVGCDDGEF